MTAQPLLRKVLATDWNASAGKTFDWDRAEAVAIVYRKGLTEMQPSSRDVAASQTQFKVDTVIGTTARPANDPVLRILMVEDSEDDCDLICYRLEKCGYRPRVERVFCEEAMRAALEREPWDIVFTDHGLPGFSGTAAVALIRKMGLRIPVLCITGTPNPAIIREILAAGVFSCISKNDLSLLCWSVERALNDNANAHP